MEKPIIFNIPNNITQGTDNGLPTALVTWVEPTAVDNSGIQTLTSTHIPGSSFNIGVTFVTYTSVDAAGHETTRLFSVSVEGNGLLKNHNHSKFIFDKKVNSKFSYLQEHFINHQE